MWQVRLLTVYTGPYLGDTGGANTGAGVLARPNTATEDTATTVMHWIWQQDKLKKIFLQQTYRPHTNIRSFKIEPVRYGSPETFHLV